MAILNCKMCGGELNITAGVSVCECEYCGSKQTVPSINDEKKTKLYERANKLRASCEFDRAYSVYESIIDDFGDEAEAHWGLILCKYGIEYVDDPKTGKKIPTCHRSSYECVLDDEAFEMVMENADESATEVYREQAKEIEEIRKNIIEVSSKEEPYDIFICYKETDENKERTIDSVLAQDVYEALTTKGYRVFFARISLENNLGKGYEPVIFSALNSAKVMLAFGTKYSYFNAVWVKNEWSRFLKMMEKDKEKYLIPCYKDIDAYDMPKEFKHLQAQDMGKVGAIQDLVRGIEKLIPKNQEPKQTVETVQTSSVAPIIKRAETFLAERDFEKASEVFESALNQDMENDSALLGKLLAENKCTSIDELVKAGKFFNNTKNYSYLIKYCSPSMKMTVEGALNDIYENILKEVNEALKAKNFSLAMDLCKKAEVFKKDADLMAALLLIEFKSSDIEELSKGVERIDKSDIYKKIISMGDSEANEALEDVSESIKNNVFNGMRQSLKDKDFKKAQDLSALALEYGKNNKETLLTLLLIEYKMSSIEELLKSNAYFKKSVNYEKYLSVCSYEEKQELEKNLNEKFNSYLKALDNSLEKRDFQGARSHAEKILKVDSKNDKALLALLLIEYQITDLSEAKKKRIDYTSSTAYKSIVSSGSNELKSKVKATLKETVDLIKAEEIAKQRAEKRKRIIAIRSSIAACLVILTVITVLRHQPMFLYDYEKNGSEITITERNKRLFGNYENIVIPSEIKGRKVTKIGDRAFYKCTSLKGITIPDSVTSIGGDAFVGCPIKEATIPANASSSISSSTLETVVISGGESIGDKAFYRCTSLTSVTIPDSVTSIGGSAFYGCKSLTSITIPDSVTSIGDYAFRDCTSLKGITIPDSVTSISDHAFSCCTSLTSITIPDSVTSIGKCAFRDCTSLTSITIPDSVTSIGGSAFYGCPIKEATIPTNAISYIPQGSLEMVVISSGKSIGNSAFEDCTSLKGITIPDSVTSIGDSAFEYCISLNGITIPDSVTSIGDFAFAGCTSLKGINIPDSVTSIGNRAFSGCRSLTSVTIGNSVTSIGSAAFRGCTSLTSITIPDSVTRIGSGVFEDCSNLTIYCEAESKPSGWDSNWNSDRPVVWGYKG